MLKIKNLHLKNKDKKMEQTLKMNKVIDTYPELFSDVSLLLKEAIIIFQSKYEKLKVVEVKNIKLSTIVVNIEY